MKSNSLIKIEYCISSNEITKETTVIIIFIGLETTGLEQNTIKPKIINTNNAPLVPKITINKKDATSPKIYKSFRIPSLSMVMYIKTNTDGTIAYPKRIGAIRGNGANIQKLNTIKFKIPLVQKALYKYLLSVSMLPNNNAEDPFMRNSNQTLISCLVSNVIMFNRKKRFSKINETTIRFFKRNLLFKTKTVNNISVNATTGT